MAALCVTLGAGTASASTKSARTMLPGTTCQVLPTNNILNTPISKLPVSSDSATWLAAMNASTSDLHPDFEIPWQIVPTGTPLVSVTFKYPTQSYTGAYPFSASTPIQSGAGNGRSNMVIPSKCAYYQIGAAAWNDGAPTAGSGALWNLKSNALSPVGWPGGSASGIPGLPGLVNYDEADSGVMDHAINFYVPCVNSHIWPAVHGASTGGNDCPPLGARFRLDASFSLPKSKCDSICQTVVTTMKTYGIILTDSVLEPVANWFFEGTPNPRWTHAQLNQLKAIPASSFVAVDESCLEMSATSAEAYQPGTATYTARCG
jgi:hypothetical protein